MPFADGRGPKWTRPLVVDAEKRLSGLNPVVSFLSSLLRGRRRAVSPAGSRAPRVPSGAPPGEGGVE